jgi:Pyruvate/2-oxoacid:ferredoxin oxidoreductase gamma subunit
MRIDTVSIVVAIGEEVWRWIAKRKRIDVVTCLQEQKEAREEEYSKKNKKKGLPDFNYRAKVFVEDEGEEVTPIKLGDDANFWLSVAAVASADEDEDVEEVLEDNFSEYEM